jgi:predicted phage tail protein
VPVQSELQTAPLHVINLSIDSTWTPGLAATNQRAVTVSWNAPLNDFRGHAGAHVWVSINNSDFTLHETVSAGRASSEIEASVGDLVRFRVIAYDMQGFVAPTVSAPIAAIELAADTRAPIAPGNLIATGGLRLIALRWDRPEDPEIKSFEIFENTTNNYASAYKIAEVVSNTHTVNGLNPSVTRYYWVRSLSYSNRPSTTVAGPAFATTSQLLVNDIADGILTTAKFASSIRPVGTPANDTELQSFKQLDQIIFPRAGVTDSVTAQILQAQRLYRWTGTEWATAAAGAFAD